MKNPPVFVSLLGFLALLAGFAYLFFGLRILGFDWFGVLGDLPAFEQVGLWGWLAAATGGIWILVAIGLWSLQPWARLFAMFMAGFALIEAAIAFIQFPGTGVGLAMAILPAVIIWYFSMREVKAVFEEGDEVAPAPAPAAAAAPVAVAAAAAAPAEPAPAPAPVALTAPMMAAAGAAVAGREPDAAPAEEPVADAAPAAPAHHMPIEDVEGIGPAYAAKLSEVGIATTSDLLAAGAKPYARDRIAEQTGISTNLIREWVDIVDLMRVPGVGPQYSDLLESAGVGSPAELAQRNAANLAITLQEVVAARPGIVRRIPTEAEIAGWIEAAGSLETAVEH